MIEREWAREPFMTFSIEVSMQLAACPNTSIISVSKPSKGSVLMGRIDLSICEHFDESINFLQIMY